MISWKKRSEDANITDTLTPAQMKQLGEAVERLQETLGKGLKICRGDKVE